MKKTAYHSLKHSLPVAALMLATACAGETTLGVERASVLSTGSAAVLPDLSACPDLGPPAGSKLAFHVYAEGVQIYRWSGTAWTFVAPDARLYADAGGKGLVGIHYGGPTWESLSGSKVVGAVQQRCTPDPNAIQWLLLGAVSADGPGIFDRVAFIQRLFTTGGVAPSTNGSVVGEEARVPYTTEYYFYRAPK